MNTVDAERFFAQTFSALSLMPACANKMLFVLLLILFSVNGA